MEKNAPLHCNPLVHGTKWNSLVTLMLVTYHSAENTVLSIGGWGERGKALVEEILICLQAQEKPKEIPPWNKHEPEMQTITLWRGKLSFLE